MSAEAIPANRVMIRWPWATRWDLELSVHLLQAAARRAGVTAPVDVAAISGFPAGLHVYGVTARQLITGLTAHVSANERLCEQVVSLSPRTPTGEIDQATVPEHLQARWDRLEKETDHAIALRMAIVRSEGENDG